MMLSVLAGTQDVVLVQQSPSGVTALQGVAGSAAAGTDAPEALDDAQRVSDMPGEPGAVPATASGAHT